MAKQTLTDFSLPTDAYASFDAVSLKALIKERLDETSMFTDQNYEGSNLSSLIDIISYSYHVLLFYLNQTSSESLFTEAELYENMNRIVKSLDYKPVGPQTSNLSFNATVDSTLPQGTYTIPRYSFLDASGIFFSFRNDVTFSKTQDSTQTLTQLVTDNLLYQGKFEEYPLITARGEEFETFTLIPGDDVITDHFSIDVYVNRANTDTWEQWTRTSSLYLENSDDKKYEVRLNENKRYELKFGNGTTGTKLKAGDIISVYYLKSEGKAGEISAGGVDGSTLAQLHTVQFTSIFDDIKDTNTDYITDSQILLLQFTNVNASSLFSEGETVDDIRSRAPNTFSAQHRLVTKDDYESHVRQNFSNVIKDVKIANNWDHLDGHMKYLMDTIKLSSSNKDPNSLFNHVMFADSCDFNNIYIYAVPTLEKTVSSTVRANYLRPAQKSAIINSIRDKKILTTETIVVDPVYIAVDVGAISTGESATEAIAGNTKLQLVREVNSSRSFDSIKNNAYTIIKDNLDSSELGKTLDITAIVTDMLNITGVTSIKTVRSDTSLEIDGLSLLVWNPIYPHDDIMATTANAPMPYFKFTYLNDPTGFMDKITVVSESTSTGSVEF
jgi:hypothetical protein